ncbi:hypothetical protein HETIRDRAFT_434497 [Heterobasidion irregulare TC 32-1]|uniref:Uncharacterized protein n=1 Tax=Heterobasidion irregulare (strain TC 32-1) TaxID=747525 RepID=W4K3C3_HETIT|nr:uncharacterized protein HETIRDRAFT_434497 [Heterobasidion irregulare TC 32-1]ETW80323.1 hypothetical protein HETIRDRAFT_434497 [Heterobasidion irregulare TC 32-1]
MRMLACRCSSVRRKLAGKSRTLGRTWYPQRPAFLARQTCLTSRPCAFLKIEMFFSLISVPSLSMLFIGVGTYCIDTRRLTVCLICLI